MLCGSGGRMIPDNMKNVVYYHEVFTSINGETTDSGRPCTFIRFFGCSAGCSYCDTPQLKKDLKRNSIETLVKKAITLGVPYVCITGGEPLEQPDVLYPLVYELLYNGFDVAIETNGCCLIEEEPYKRSYRYIMDVKCPSSGIVDKNVTENMFQLKSNDEVKFVIKDRADYEYALNVINSYQIPAQILFSPMSSKNGKFTVGKDLVKWVLEDKLYKVKITPQIHHIMGVK